MHYFIHYDDGAAHWSDYKQGWSMDYVNSEKGWNSNCGEEFCGGGIGICMSCYNTKKKVINSLCEEFSAALHPSFSAEIQSIIEKGKSIRVTKIVYV